MTQNQFIKEFKLIVVCFFTNAVLPSWYKPMKEQQFNKLLNRIKKLIKEYKNGK